MLIKLLNTTRPTGKRAKAGLEYDAEREKQSVVLHSQRMQHTKDLHSQLKSERPRKDWKHEKTKGQKWRWGGQKCHQPTDTVKGQRARLAEMPGHTSSSEADTLSSTNWHRTDQPGIKRHQTCGASIKPSQSVHRPIQSDKKETGQSCGCQSEAQ